MDRIRFLERITLAATACGLALEPTVTKFCLVAAAAAAVRTVIDQIQLTKNNGSIKEMSLSIANTTTDGVDQATTPILLDIDNYNNNQEHLKQTSSAKHIKLARLTISTYANWAEVFSELIGQLKSLTEITFVDDAFDLIVTNIQGLLASTIDEAKDDPSNWIRKNITPTYLENSRKWAYYSDGLDPVINPIVDAIPDLNPRDCIIPDKGGKNSVVRLFDSFSDRFYVPDLGSIMNQNINVGGCFTKIKELYRLPSEDDVHSQLEFKVKRYAKVEIKLIGKGAVSYSRPSAANNPACSSYQSPCVEYFEVTYGKPNADIRLTATPEDGSVEVEWKDTLIDSGTPCTKGSRECEIPLYKDAGILNTVLNEKTHRVDVRLENMPDGVYVLKGTLGPAYSWSTDACWEGTVGKGCYPTEGGMREWDPFVGDFIKPRILEGGFINGVWVKSPDVFDFAAKDRWYQEIRICRKSSQFIPRELSVSANPEPFRSVATGAWEFDENGRETNVPLVWTHEYDLSYRLKADESMIEVKGLVWSFSHARPGYRYYAESIIRSDFEGIIKVGSFADLMERSEGHQGRYSGGISGEVWVDYMWNYRETTRVTRKKIESTNLYWEYEGPPDDNVCKAASP